MSKPKLMKFDQFARMTLQRYERYLPTAFDESLTLLEKMNKLIEYLNAMGVLVNDVVDQWNEVMEWVVSDGINDVVIDRLNEMAVDGTLEELINVTIFNELNDKISDVKSILERTPSATTTSISIYVGPQGNDLNDGLSESAPFKTFERAVDEIPDVINKDHEYRLVVMQGVYSETINISNKTVNGQLIVLGATSNRQLYQVERVRMENITGDILVTNLSCRTSEGVGFRFERCTPHVRVHNVEDVGIAEVNTTTGYIGLLADYGSNVVVSASNFESKRYGIRSNYLSRVFSMNNTGDGNVFGVGGRWGGIIQTYGTVPNGNDPTATTIDSSGILIDGRGFRYSVPRDETHMYDRSTSRVGGQYNTNMYSLTSTQSSNVEIGDDEKLVIYFNNNQYGVNVVEFQYGGQGPGFAGEYLNGIFSGYFGSGYINSNTINILASSVLTVDNVLVENTGGLNFKMEITPNRGTSGRWRLDLKTKIFGNNPAPTIESVEIEKI